MLVKMGQFSLKKKCQLDSKKINGQKKVSLIHCHKMINLRQKVITKGVDFDQKVVNFDRKVMGKGSNSSILAKR